MRDPAVLAGDEEARYWAKVKWAKVTAACGRLWRLLTTFIGAAAPPRRHATAPPPLPIS